MLSFLLRASRTQSVLVLAVCLILLSLAPLFAQVASDDQPSTPSAPTSAPPTSPEPAKPEPSAKPKAPPVNPVTEAAVKAGVLTAASRINQILTFLTTNTKYAAYLFTPREQPDQSMFSVSLGLESKDLAEGYASASFAPTTNGRVAAVYDTVQYVAKSCEEVEKTIFKDLKRKGNLGKDIVILDGRSVTIFLMPAGPGCVVIRKEVVR